jgi:hypothetical protein
MAFVYIHDDLLNNDHFREFLSSLLERKPERKPVMTAKEATPAVRANLAIALFCDEYAARYPGSKTLILKKDAALIKRLVIELGLERMEALIRGYFQMPDADIVKKAHSISYFSVKIPEIKRFVDTGAFVTNQQALEVDRELFKKVKETQEDVKRREELSAYFKPKIEAPDDAG